MTDTYPTFSLMLPSDPRMLSVTRAFLEAACQAVKADRHATHAVILACSEAVVNIIRHAHRDKPDAQIQLRMVTTADEIVLELLDEGEPFDIDGVPHLNPGELRLGGRGVFMMRSLMDEITCERCGETGNLLRMVKRCRTTVRNCG